MSGLLARLNRIEGAMTTEAARNTISVIAIDADGVHWRWDAVRREDVRMTAAEVALAARAKTIRTIGGVDLREL